MPVRLAGIDLNYLLRQVRIGTDYTQLFGALDPSGVREVNGANNNLVGAYDSLGNYIAGGNPWGQSTTADTNFLQLSHTNTPGLLNQGTTYHTVDPNNPMEMGTSVVFDSSPRLITNLISSSVTDILSPIYNPAAVAARDANAGGAGDGTNLGGYDVSVGNSVYPQSGTTTGAFIGDQGVLGGATFNEFFVAFGQFFDHGLDFISKGGGFVAITLSPNDPLYIDPSDPAYVPGASNVMYLNRASLTNPATDFDSSGNLLAGVVPTYNNNTGFLIDQSQTYGSHATINALLRQYDGNGRATGLLITSAEDGNVTSYDGTAFTTTAASAGAAHQMATWADLVYNATRIGVILTDADSQDVPALRVDNTGRLLFTPNGTQWSTAVPSGWTGLAGQDASDPFLRNADGTVVRSNQTFFADMAQGTNTASNDPNVRDPLLAIHYVSGDGRTNENIGLTAVHNIFHEEHNLQSRNVMGSVLTEALRMQSTGSTDAEVAAYINQWTRTAGSTVGASETFTFADSDGNPHSLTVAGVNLDNTSGNVAWDGDAVFQAGRLITESEYNHIAINDYVRSMAVLLPEFVSYSTDVQPNVSLEFAQAIFRLGHSMLTEQLHVAVTDANGHNPGEAGYVETFNSSGNVDLFDAFLNPGLYEATGGAAITLGLLRQQANQIDEFVTPALQQTLVGAPLDLAALNIARGRDVGLPTLNELRQQVYNGQVAYNVNNAGSALAPYTSWQDFGAHLRTPESLVNFIAAYGRDNNVGGHDWGLNEARDAYQAGTMTLADIRAVAQGILDAYTTASDPNHTAAVAFMEGEPTYNSSTGQWEFGAGDQGFWDIDLWIGGLAERPTFDGPLGTTFTYIMLDFGQRLMDGDRFYYLYRMPVGQHLGDELLSHTFSEMIERTTGLEHTGAAFGMQTGRFILDAGNNFFNASQHQLPNGDAASNGHIIVAGGDGNDYIIGGVGDDYLYGDAGNDTIQGSQGNDNIFGGAGDDWIYDDENDDTINGGDGNDHIFAGPGILDVAHGAAGDDEVHGGDGIDEVYGDDGNDSLYGEGDTDLMMGGEGNDYMNGGDGVDEMFGGNGNDWMQGGVGDDNLNGGSGNDLLEGGLGATANDGDRLNGDSPVAFGTTIIEWNGDGTQGDMDIASYEDVSFAVTANLQTSNGNGTNSTLMDTYAFLEGVVGGRMNDTLIGADANTTTSNGANNYLIGGGGNDTITGLGGFDIIVGDSAQVDGRLYMALDDQDGHYFDVNGEHSAFTGMITDHGEQRTTFADGTRGHVLGDNGVAGNADTAVYRGSSDEYTVMYDTFVDVDGTVRPVLWVMDTVAGRDDYDALIGIEYVQFTNGTFTIAQLLNELPVIDSNGGGDAAGIGLDEGTLAVTTVHASDPNNVLGDPLNPQTLVYSISTAATADNVDAALFTINASTGELTFVSAPNFEAPSDAGANNVYNVVVQVSDGIATDTQALTVTVGNLNEAQTGALNITGATVAGNTVTLTATNTLADPDATAPIGQTWSGGGGTGTTANYTVTATSTVQTVTLSSTYLQSGALPSVTVTAPETARIGRNAGDTMAGGAGVDYIFGMGGNDTLNGGLGNDLINGGAGTDTAVFSATVGLQSFSLNGSGQLVVTGADGVDTVDGSVERGSFGADANLTFVLGTAGADGALSGSTTATTSELLIGFDGADNIHGGLGGNDLMVGGGGDDTLNGGAGTDTAVYSGNLSDFTVVSTGSTFLTVQDWVGAQGTDSLISTERLRIGGTTFAVTWGTAAANTQGGPAVNTATTSLALFGLGGIDTLNGGTVSDILNGGAGNDTVNGGDGDDLIVQSSTEGRDVIDGGNGIDTYSLVGDASVETFNIYSATEWLLLGGANHTLQNASTGIVITRNGTTNTEVVAELRNVEELHILTGNGATGALGSGTTTGGTGDTINVIGNFVGTGLAYNTITVNGVGNTVDITGLSSDHRVVLNGDGSSIVGAIRPQDVINGNASATPADAFVLPSSQPGAFTHDTDFGLGLRDLSLFGGFDMGNTAWRQDFIADHGMAGFGHGDYGHYGYMVKHDYLAHLTGTMDDWAL